MRDDTIIIVKKKASGHAGHHGGAWKVAYADFVTAMMALFIVLWLMGSSKPVVDAVGGYFRDPKGLESKKGTGLAGASAMADAKKDELAELEEQLRKAIEKMTEKLQKQIEMHATPEGLRIEMIETPNGTFFENGKPQPKPALVEVLKVLAEETGKLPNPVSIEGHTDSKPFSGAGIYGNWELSTERANASRRLMEANGLRSNQVVQVRGFADRNLRKPLQPEDASNRRITIIVQYTVKVVAPQAFVFNSNLPASSGPSAAGASPLVPPALGGKTPATEIKQ